MKPPANGSALGASRASPRATGLAAASLSRPEIHQRALRAAAAVASLGLACSNSAQSVVTGSNATQDVAVEVAASADTSPEVAAVDAAADGKAPVDAAPETTVADAAPETTVADAAADGNPATDAGTAADVAADVTAQADGGGAKPDCKTRTGQATSPSCCELLSNWCEANFPPGSKEANDCYFGPNFDGSTGCVPWGPPAPPAMDSAALGWA